MLICAKCGCIIKECCDIYFPVIDEHHNDAGVVCGVCGERMDFAGETEENWFNEDGTPKQHIEGSDEDEENHVGNTESGHEHRAAGANGA